MVFFCVTLEAENEYGCINLIMLTVFLLLHMDEVHETH